MDDIRELYRRSRKERLYKAEDQIIKECAARLDEGRPHPACAIVDEETWWVFVGSPAVQYKIKAAVPVVMHTPAGCVDVKCCPSLPPFSDVIFAYHTPQQYAR